MKLSKVPKVLFSSDIITRINGCNSSIGPWKTVILHIVATSSKQRYLILVLNENQMTFGNDHQCKTDPNMKFHQLNRRNIL